jgi:hypothetical protein
MFPSPPLATNLTHSTRAREGRRRAAANFLTTWRDVAEAAHSALARRRDEPVICANPKCGRTVRRRSRHQRYCSSRCRVSAHRAKKAVEPTKIVARYPRSGHETRPPKKAQDFNGLQDRFSRSTLRISGPRHVIEVEVFGGRVWQALVGPDGIAVQLSRLRQRALMEPRP